LNDTNIIHLNDTKQIWADIFLNILFVSLNYSRCIFARWIQYPKKEAEAAKWFQMSSAKNTAAYPAQMQNGLSYCAKPKQLAQKARAITLLIS
jgi:hypothetical protein